MCIQIFTKYSNTSVTMIRARKRKSWAFLQVLICNVTELSSVLTVSTLNYTVHTLIFYMVKYFLPLYYFSTIIWTINFLILTIIMDMIVYVIYFTLPLASFIFFVTIHEKTPDFAINLLVNVTFKLTRTTYWTTCVNKMCFTSIKTRLAEYIPTTHSEVRIFTRIVTYLTDYFIWWIIHKLVLVSS